MKRRQHGDIVLRIDTLRDGQEIFWLQNGITAMQLTREEVTDLYHVIKDDVKHKWNDRLPARVAGSAIAAGIGASLVTSIIVSGV